MSKKLEGKVALVTGASRGLGYATAVHLAREGAHVIATARTKGGLEELRGIRATTEKLVKDEDPKSPLTDQAIVEVLERDGIKIARRTVAKYRDQLGVLSARMRKRV